MKQNSVSKNLMKRIFGALTARTSGIFGIMPSPNL